MVVEAVVVGSWWAEGEEEVSGEGNWAEWACGLEEDGLKSGFWGPNWGCWDEMGFH